MSIVSNTGPVLHLWEAGLLDLLPGLADVSIPPAVQSEMGHLIADWLAPPWLSARAPTEFATQALAWVDAGVIDRGEAEAIALALELGAGWFLTDDNAARLLGISVGLEVHGSVAVVLEAARVRLLDLKQAHDALDRLAGTSLWVSRRVLRKAAEVLADL